MALGIISSIYQIYTDKEGWLLTNSQIKDLAGLSTALREHKDPLATFLWNGISDDLRNRLTSQVKTDDVRELRSALVKDINTLLLGNCIFSADRFPDLSKHSAETRQLLSGLGFHGKTDSVRLNRRLLGEALAAYISAPRKSSWLPDPDRWKPFGYAGLLLVGALTGAIAWEAWRRSPLHRHGLYYSAKCVFLGYDGAGAAVKRKEFLVDGGRGYFDGAFSIFTDGQCRHTVVPALVIAFMLGLASVAPLWFFSSAVDGVQFGWQVLENPGGIFALVTGIFTLVGTFVAIKSIIETRQIITSFPELTHRLVTMIKEDSKQKGSGVLFMSYTPLPGAWNLGPKLKRKANGVVFPELFSAELQQELMSDKNKVRVVCLKLGEDGDMAKFLGTFKDKVMKSGTIDKGMIDGFREACEGLKDAFAAMKRSDSAQPAHWAANPRIFKSSMCERTNDQMPDYYIFVSATRAIIVVPIGMPTLRHPDVDEKYVHVETLGFETTERHVIAALRREFYRFDPDADQDDDRLPTDRVAN